MKKLVLKKQDYKKIVNYCLEEKPDEACGIMAGTKVEDTGRVQRVYLMDNTEASPEDYLMDPEEQFSVFRDMRENDLELLSIFHSHPHSQALPSTKDIDMAYYPEAFYTIISLEKREIDFRSFIIKDDYQKVEVIIV